MDNHRGVRAVQRRPCAGGSYTICSQRLTVRRMSSSSSRSERNPLEYDEEDHEPPVQEVVNEQDLLLPRAPKLESSDDKVSRVVYRGSN